MRKQFSKLLPVLAIAGGIFIYRCGDTDTPEGIQSRQKGEDCDQEHLCMSGLICEDGKCRVLCSTKDDCDPKEHCENNRCVANLSNACPAGFTGDLCDQCLPDHWGKECAPCNCSGHGTCNAGLSGNGSCSCAAGWDGPNCDECAAGWDGPNCDKCDLTKAYGKNCTLYGSITDQEGNSYKTVIIGNQEWMAENYRRKTGTYYYPDNNSSNTNTYGLLYPWAIASAANFCPSGWHLPSKADFDELLTYVDNNKSSSSTSFLSLIANSAAWKEGYKNKGLDEFGFGALPAGFYYSGYYSLFGHDGDWWSATEINSSVAYFLSLGYGYANVYYNNLTFGFSVRCLKDEG